MPTDARHRTDCLTRWRETIRVELVPPCTDRNLALYPSLQTVGVTPFKVGKQSRS
jgi:hypothetical protein